MKHCKIIVYSFIMTQIMSETHKLDDISNQIKVDIIVLGCSLSGMVTAYKLKKTFGDTMEIVILDLANTTKSSLKQDGFDDDDRYNVFNGTAREVADNLTKYYLTVYANMYQVQIPKSITEPELFKSNLKKVFENENGDVQTYDTNPHEFNFLNVFEQFELNQYQIALDENMKDLFQVKQNMSGAAERKKLMYFDRTNMEQDICSSLLFPTCRNIMRNTVRLVCGVSPKEVSVLFFLYQCYRTGSVTNNLDGSNTKLREKLLGYFKKHLSSKLYQRISNIALPIKPIKEIGSFAGEKVILKTLVQGDTNYVCNHLAVALKPEELCSIQFEPALLTEKQKSIFSSMTKGRSKKFWIQYEEKFWRMAGYSGDIFSLRGPILWATEQPKLPYTAKKDLHPILVGYLKCNGDRENSEEAVKQQLVDLFGEDAAIPVSYTESAIADVYAPLCGNFLALRRLQHTSHKLEWGALDIFGEGDVAAALEAGHNAYMHLVAYLRPQAQTYEDLVVSNWPTFFNDTSPFRRWFSAFNFASSTRVALYATAAYIGYRVLRHLNS